MDVSDVQRHQAPFKVLKHLGGSIQANGSKELSLRVPGNGFDSSIVTIETHNLCLAQEAGKANRTECSFTVIVNLQD